MTRQTSMMRRLASRPGIAVDLAGVTDASVVRPIADSAAVRLDLFTYRMKPNRLYAPKPEEPDKIAYHASA
ncbi:hypothetical protein [Bifidobacterium samirii]|uniref:Uncharacterized protein n=1 Tax=Bifidobacterium samirii TaxID=2306974 RepID=A0A430FR74_9BIFI|nr:hypothetical protein [Bifidobacterium samirii]RSX55353.1 hypothetical protein D2E24_1368 [Bifidobacterium samirii]